MPLLLPSVYQHLRADAIRKAYNKWQQDEMEPTLLKIKAFVTAPIQKGGLALSEDLFPQALQFTRLKHGLGLFSDGNLFFGNRIGSMGEVSIFACLLGALFLLVTKIGSYRTMAGFAVGMIVAASLLSFFSQLGSHKGLLAPAIFDFPIYKHFLMGGAMFGLVFMATDPVSSPGLASAQVDLRPIDRLHGDSHSDHQSRLP